MLACVQFILLPGREAARKIKRQIGFNMTPFQSPFSKGSWRRYGMGAFSALLGSRWIPLSMVQQYGVSCGAFFVVSINMLSNKQSNCRWFQTPSHSCGLTNQIGFGRICKMLHIVYWRIYASENYAIICSHNGCRLIGTKPLSEPLLGLLSDLREHISMESNFIWKSNIFISWNCIWKRRLQCSKLNQQSCQSCCVESQIINIKLKKSFKKSSQSSSKVVCFGLTDWQ